MLGIKSIVVLQCLACKQVSRTAGTLTEYNVQQLGLILCIFCRLLRHDMVAELCESAVRFKQAGGSDSLALPKGATSGRANLPGIDDDMSLFVYGNVEIKNLMTAKFGAGVQYEVAL